MKKHFPGPDPGLDPNPESDSRPWVAKISGNSMESDLRLLGSVVDWFETALRRIANFSGLGSETR